MGLVHVLIRSWVCVVPMLIAGFSLHAQVIDTTRVILPPADSLGSLEELFVDTTEQETPSLVPLGNDDLSGPRYYRRIITPNAITRRGLFVVHKVEDRYYFEIPDSVLGRDLLVVSRIARGAAGVRPGYSGYPGDEIGTTVIRFEKGPSDNIFLRRISFADNLGDSTNSTFNAVVRSNLQPLAASFGISAYTPNRKASVVDVTHYINGDNDVLFFSPGVKQQMKVGSMLSNMCYIKDIQPSPLSVDIRTIKTYEQTTSSGISFTWELNTSIFLLPRVPMTKRFADRRVGYFTERYTDYNANPQGVEVVSYIKRWRLEPRPEDLEKYRRGILVEPAKPIVFYIDPVTPRKWVPYLMQGVNDWQPAFEKAGFKNAIIARYAPIEDPEEDGSWTMEDTRHSMIVYKPSSWTNATGHIITDPRSGEILESHINFYHNIMSLLRTWYMVQCGATDPRAQAPYFDDELMGSLIRSVVSHETGHALGLLHNFGASSTTPVERLRDKDWLARNGHCPSIMDYARFNYVAQPEDSVSPAGLISRIGIYDHWAIEWGYRYFPDLSSAEEEKRALNSVSLERLEDEHLWYGSEFSPDDPRSQTEDVGDNAMLAGEYGIRNLKRIVPNLVAWTTREGEGYAGLSEVYGALLNQFTNYLRHATTYIGGTYETLKTAEQKGGVYQPVPAHLQRNAMGFLDEHIFQTPHWLLDTAILSRVGMSAYQVISRRQSDIIGDLLSLNRMHELIHAEAMYGDYIYNLQSFLYDLDKSVWRELDDAGPIDIYRRSLQRIYIDKMLAMLRPEMVGKGYTDVIPTVTSQLRRHRQKIAKALRKTDHALTRDHLQFIYDQLNEVLPPEKKWSLW